MELTEPNWISAHNSDVRSYWVQLMCRCNWHLLHYIFITSDCKINRTLMICFSHQGLLSLQQKRCSPTQNVPSKRFPLCVWGFFFFFLHFTLTYPEIFPAKSLLQSTWQRIMRGKVLRVPFTSMWSLQGHLSAVPGYMVHHRGKVGGSVQLHWLQALVVGFHHAIDSRTIRVLRVPVLHSREQTLKKTKMLNGVLIFFFPHDMVLQIALTKANSWEIRPSGGSLAPKPSAGNILSLS